MSFRMHRSSAPVALALALAFIGAPMVAHAQAAETFRLPAQPLSDSLRAIGQQTHVNIAFDPATVSGHRAASLSGAYTTSQALERLLAGTGLVARVTPGGSYWVEKGGASGAGGGSTAAAGNDAATGKVTLDTVVVTAKVEGFSATRMSTELREIPQSVSVITQDVMQQQNALSLADAFQWATGITSTRGNPTDTGYSIRGFGVGTYHVDGGAPLMLNPGSGANGYQDLSEYERVEVLRGADALFGGAGNPGGSVNLVRKRPQAELAANVAASIGSWSNYHVEGDVTGPLSSSGNLRGRLVMAHDDQDYFYDTVNRKLTKLYGVLDFDLTRNTLLSVGASVEDMNYVGWKNGLPRYSTGADAHLPRSTALTFPWSRQVSTKTEVFAKLEHRFNAQWKLNLNATRTEQDQNGPQGSFAAAINPVTRRIDSPLTVQEGEVDLAHTAMDTTLTGAFDWNGRSQEVVAGMDYLRAPLSWDSLSYSVPVKAVNPFDFDPRAYPRPVPSAMAVTSAATMMNKQFGAYMAFRLRPWDGWSIIGGVRNSYLRASSTINMSFAGMVFPSMSSTAVSSGELTPYAGVVYDLNRQYSLYASYADVFRPNNAQLTASGAAVSPQTGTNLEAGLKAAWWDGRLNGSLALFKIDQSNASFKDPNIANPPNMFCCYLTGTNKSKGVEAELNGALMPGWLISSGYTFNVNHNTTGAALNTQTPKHLFKLWSNYQLTGDWNRWNVGGGVTAQTSNYTWGTACTAFNTQGKCAAPLVLFRAVQGFYTVVTLRTGYRISPNWDAALNINNAFDRRYYQTISGPALGSWYGEPRNAMLTVRGSF